MRPGKNELIGDPGCAGCRKRCRYNGPVMAPWRAEERKGLDLYGCNSSLRLIVARETTRWPLLPDVGALFGAAAKAMGRLGEALAANPML